METRESGETAFIFIGHEYVLHIIKQMNFEEIMLNFVKLYEGTIHV